MVRASQPTWFRDIEKRPFAIPFGKALSAPLTLASNTVVDSYTLEMTAGHGFSAGNTIAIFTNSSNPYSFFAQVISVSTNTLTLDRPLPRIFPATSAVVFSILVNANVDGSVTPQSFVVDNDSNARVEITKINFYIEDGSDMDSSKFGGISALTRGVLLRKEFANGTYDNFFCFKKNGSFKNVVDNIDYGSKAPAGKYSFGAFLSLSGSTNLNAPYILNKDEKLEIIIQDDLTDLDVFAIKAIGNILI